MSQHVELTPNQQSVQVQQFASLTFIRTMLAVHVATASLSAAEVDADEVGSAIHGFMGMQLKTDYITPRGLWVHDDGAALQIVNGLVFVTSESTSLVIGTWSDINLWNQHHPKVDAWNEFDWFIGFNYNAGKWAFGLQYVEFLRPPNIVATEKHAGFSGPYDDSTPGGSLALKPYAQFLHAVRGGSAVVLGEAGNTWDVELGVTPTLAMGSA